MKFLRVIYLVGGLPFAAASIVSPPVMAAVNLQVSIETHNTPSQASSKIPPDSQKTLEVTLADEYISVKSAQETSIFDFKMRRRIVLDNEAKTYVDNSLYDILGFRVFEYKNRETLHLAAKAANLPLAGQEDAPNIEHNLSIQSPRSSTKMDEKDKEGGLVFSSGDQQFAHWSKKGFEVSATDSERFSKFIRYTQGGHPQILSKLAIGNLIPSKLVFTFTEFWGTSVRSVSINSFHQINSNSYDLSLYSKRKSDSPSDGIDNILDQAADLMLGAMEIAKVNYLQDIENSFHDGQILDALLGSTELTLMAQSMPVFSPEQLVMLRGDPSAQKLTIAMKAKTKETVTEAVKTLVELRPQAPKKSYILKLYEANYRIQLGDPILAKRLFLEALQNNLLLAGAYKDLGDLLLMEFDTPRAWRCWDMGRRLVPKYENFTVVDQFEKSLIAQYPEYF